MFEFPEDIGTTRYEDDVLAVLGALQRRRLPKQPIAFYGSSSFRFWQSMISDLDCADIVNLGFGGGTFRSGLHHFDRLLAPLQPKKVVIYFGENDISNDGLSAQSTLANMRALHERIRSEFPEARTFFLSAKQSPTKWPYHDVVTEFNACAKAYCAGTGDADFIDVTTPLLGEHGRPIGKLYVEDWVHLNALGYARWAKILLAHPGLFREA